MAIINNNVQNVKFLRNQDVNITREAAISLLNTHKEDAADGTALLARYTVSGTVKTIVGFVYVTGSTHDITIFDTEGASGDVEELRQEINAKLGEGITSSNTATAQLAALSGNGQSTSAETSVEGAKRYADELKNQMDYSGVTTGTGVYVTNVTQADGIVSATTATLPSVTDAKEAKKVVVSVSENKGEISIERGTISSTAETMVLTDNTDGGVNFEVNIDNDTIIQDADTKKLKVADTALVQYVGDEDTIHISVVDAQNNKTVSSLLTISATTPSEANVKEQYNLVGASGNTIGATIKIYKDSALLSVALLHADTTADPQVLPTYDKTNGWTDIAETAQTAENQALCYAYEDVNGTVVIAAVPVGSFINEQEFASGITWDNTANKVRGVVDPNSESFLTVGVDGFKLAGVQDAIDDLAELSAKTITNIKSTNSSINIATANTSDSTVEVDVITDADKIQMSGFTPASTASSLSNIATSDSIATAFEKVDTVITENERVTAGALTDLDDRIDTVSGDVDTIKTNYISGASVNGTAATVSNNSIALSINSEASTGAASSPITVTTAEGGSVTLTFDGIDCGFYA